MSALNLRSPDLAAAYQAVLSGDSNTNWVLFSYSGNNLKVSGTGSGGLEELQDEFSDGRIQYAFVRVVDPNSKLNKFVQINWLGDGVPEAKKGLYYLHAGPVSAFLKGAHVTISARNETDVTPEIIMTKVNNASGSKYAVQNDAPRKLEPIAPVGTAYTPVGKINIAELRKNSPRDSPQPVQGSAYVPARHELSNMQSVTATASGARSNPRTTPLHPPVSSIPLSSPPDQTVLADAGSVASRDITPTQSAYLPVSLPPPRKLVNPFAALPEARRPETLQYKRGNLDGEPHNLTWSERQALTATQAAKNEGNGSHIRLKEGASASNLGSESRPVIGKTLFVSPPPPQLSPTHESEPVPKNAASPVLRPRTPMQECPGIAVERVVRDAALLNISDHDSLAATVLYSYEAIESNEVDLLEGDVISEIEQIDEGWWQGTTSTGHRGLFPANYVQLIENTGHNEDSSTPVITEYPHSRTQDEPAPSLPENSNLVAIAIHPYTATEDNEISFSTGDKISFVDASISGEWWQGTLPSGDSGLFPATYVELQE